MDLLGLEHHHPVIRWWHGLPIFCRGRNLMMSQSVIVHSVQKPNSILFGQCLRRSFISETGGGSDSGPSEKDYGHLKAFLSKPSFYWPKVSEEFVN
jgi:hypothetical protein